jgi:hypothetical protein
MSRMSRILLALVAAGQAELGVWGTASPRSLFEQYPGFGHHWIRALGAYDEHLVRDFAAAELGFAVLLACAAIWFERRLVLVAGAAFLAATLPHFAYHLTTTDAFSTTDNSASLIAFGLEIAAVIFAMATVVQTKTRKGAVDGTPSPRPAPRPRSAPPVHL